MEKCLTNAYFHDTIDLTINKKVIMNTLADRIYNDLTKIQDLMQREVRFLKLQGKSIIGYRVDYSTHEVCECKLLKMQFHEFDRKNLALVGLWDKLNEKEQLFVERQMEWSGDTNISRSNDGESGETKRHKMGSFMMVCKNCNHDEKMSFSALKIRLKMQDEDNAIVLSSIKDLQKSYMCSKCIPAKKSGRTRNPLFESIPKSVKCSVCSKECVVNSGNVYELTGGDTEKIKEYASNYKCRSCNPEWGSWLKGKGRKKKVEETV